MWISLLLLVSELFIVTLTTLPDAKDLKKKKSNNTISSSEIKEAKRIAMLEKWLASNMYWKMSLRLLAFQKVQDLTDELKKLDSQ